MLRASAQLTKTWFRSFFLIVPAALILGLLAAGGSFLVSYTSIGVWPPTFLTEVTAIAIGALTALSVGLLILLFRVTRTLQARVRQAALNAH
jgi:hypothetical protein